MAGESILVVDDEEDILLTLRAFLEGVMGAKVVTARSGAEALEKMAKAKEPFDLVISDYRMPAMDGLHFLRRAGEMRPEAPRVLLTAYPDTRLAIDAVNQARIVRFLTKPIDPDKLQGVVQEVVAQARRERQRQAALHRSADLAHAGPDKPAQADRPGTPAKPGKTP